MWTLIVPLILGDPATGERMDYTREFATLQQCEAEHQRLADRLAENIGPHWEGAEAFDQPEGVDDAWSYSYPTPNSIAVCVRSEQRPVG